MLKPTDADTPLSYEEACQKYPEATAEALLDVRSSRSKWKDSPPSELEWFYHQGVIFGAKTKVYRIWCRRGQMVKCSEHLRTLDHAVVPGLWSF